MSTLLLPKNRKSFYHRAIVPKRLRPLLKGIRDKQFSLDRLGPTGNVVKTARSYLIPRAKHAGTKFRSAKQFNGWVIVSVKFLEDGYRGSKFPVVASPEIASENGAAEIESNRYHAHSEIPSELDDIMSALFLRRFLQRDFWKSVQKTSRQPQTIGWNVCLPG